ncbi:cyclic nucleotide-binding domain-containing protein [Bradyrhizobium sp. Pear77]|uniref:cyclic nucleotide-binding domain-containing protein n=1 Tax=Bradyrhizobium altum TaxID=1571202 RepID=UPI00289E69D0|nr:cyclic nucleotide-binding domain-containing protein [Bradyrhizobium altum]MCC8958896.1 cyclic nucleotide-binding domain-containing protein [Bradyrhizobium altum]
MADASFSLLTGNDIETRLVRAGGIIFREGEQANELFVIKSGYVRIQVGNKTMADLPADTIFGEMALIDNEPRSATATALTDVELPGLGKAVSLPRRPDAAFCPEGDEDAGPAAQNHEQGRLLGQRDGNGPST